MSGEPAFPTLPPPYCIHDGCACKGRVFGHSPAPIWPSYIAEAWAWRCADTMPGSAQGRRDSLNDAAQLLCEYFEPDETGHTIHYAGECMELALQWGLSTDVEIMRTMYTISPTKRGLAVRRNQMVKEVARSAARAAFRACPGLR